MWRTSAEMQLQPATMKVVIELAGFAVSVTHPRNFSCLNKRSTVVEISYDTVPM